MYFNFSAGFGSRSAVCGEVGAFRDTLVRTLGTVCVCLVAALAGSGRALAFEGGQQPVVSSIVPLPSGTAPPTKALRSSDSRAPGSEVKVKWEAGKLSLDVDGVPLSEVVQAVSHQTGVEIIGAQGLSDRVFRHFAGSPGCQS